MLTKKQDKIATRIRDAGVPGDIAVLLASRMDSDGYIDDISFAVSQLFWWHLQPEGIDFWSEFADAFFEEIEELETP